MNTAAPMAESYQATQMRHPTTVVRIVVTVAAEVIAAVVGMEVAAEVISSWLRHRC